MKYKKALIAKAIYVEWRRPESILEKSLYGLTTTSENVARVFINTKARGQELSNTFFHEMTHVFFAFHKNKVPEKKQEMLAQKIGEICKEVLR
jgi:hypothetical protein